MWFNVGFVKICNKFKNIKWFNIASSYTIYMSTSWSQHWGLKFLIWASTLHKYWPTDIIMGREIGISSDLFFPLKRIFFFLIYLMRSWINLIGKWYLYLKLKVIRWFFLRCSIIHLNYYNLKPSIYVSFVSILWIKLWITSN